MEITDIQIFKVEGKGKLLGYANIVFNDSLVLKGIKIIDGSRGVFIAMPSQTIIKRKEIKRFEYYHPINNDMRNLVSDAIITAYKEAK